MIRGEVIAIGDELTTGQRLDTNTQWLSQRLTELGVTIVAHTTVADDLVLNRDAFRNAAARADVVVSTGGLGPTADDLTRDALAAASGAPLLLDEQLLEHIESLYTVRGRQMPPQNRRQAEFPEGSTPIPNNGGTAPGVDFRFNDARFFALPGVPEEMREMWFQTVSPAVASMSGHEGVMRHHLVKCFGAGESQVESMLLGMFDRGREPQVGITASKATITLRITARGADEAACLAAMQPTLATIRAELGDLIYAECLPDAEVELHHHVIDRLAAQRIRIATTEAMTGGLLAGWLAEADAGRGFFLGGEMRTAADTPQDQRALESRANEVRARGADYGLAVGRAREDEPERIPIAIAGPAGAESKRVQLVGHPSIHKPLVAKHALNLLRLSLLKTAGVKA